MKFVKNFFRKPLNWLSLAIPFVILAYFFGWGELWVFGFAALGIIPMAGAIGEATEALTEYTSPSIGGLLNATLGNVAELIITIIAIREGLLELVKASITGSIIGNILFVMGASMLLGGIKNGVQVFNRKQAGNYSILLVLAVLGLAIPSVISGAIGNDTSMKVEIFSLGVAFIMILLYSLGLFFGFRDRRDLVGDGKAEQDRISNEQGTSSQVEIKAKHTWSLRTALIILAISTTIVAVLSELLVGSVEPIVLNFGISEFFIGIILIPIIGNIAEHLVSVKVAIANHMELSVQIANASSLQIALFVAPLLVFISLIMGNPLLLIFNTFELLALISGVLIAALVSADGESNWLEGAELLAVYLIWAMAFYLLPL